MNTLDDIKKAIDALSGSQREDLLRYLASAIHSAPQAHAMQRLAFEGKWPAEEQSDLQYVIPES